MTDEEIAKAEYHLKHMKMSQLRLRINTLSNAVRSMTYYMSHIANPCDLTERLETSVAILADLTAEYCDIVQCTEICNMDDCKELEERRDE